MNKEQSIQQIQAIVEKYKRIAEAGKIKEYNEAQTRNEFIEPLFEALGWDMRNLINDNEVTTEEKVSNGRVDLAFRINGIPKMFLEAKALRIDLDNETYAKQSINYAWHKGVEWAILTDFESIKVYNSLNKSKYLADKLVFKINYTDYLTDERLWHLSKEGFLNDELDNYAEKHAKKIEKITVNEQLFKDLKECREILTKSFSAWNDDVDRDIINEGVQKILDRLIFIRVLEDRHIESPILLPILHEWQNKGNQTNLFELLVDKFRELDQIYDSSLFKPHACEKWQDIQASIAKVITILCEKDDFQYDFKDIPADILGGVYENYLSYIEKEKGKSKSEQKIESKSKRKEQGIYYTPRYIVDYIVQNTVGEKLKGVKTMEDLSKIRILDPACGSGSFLTRAFEEVNNKYKEFGAPNNQHTKNLILLNNIHGVDLDPQAVELAKLNLLIDALDEKNKLTDLTRNIRHGNSLIEDRNIDQFAFKWKEEFKEAFDNGGFDVIIGNPPYIKEYTNKSVFDGLHDNPYYQGKMDIWTLFACKSIDLLKDGGYFSFIAPNNWLTNAGASIFRDKILKEGKIIKFIDFGDFKVFREAGIQTMIFVFQKGLIEKSYKTDYIKILDKNINENNINLFLHTNSKNKDGDIIRFDASIDPSEMVGENIVFSNQAINRILNKIEEQRNFQLTEKEVGQGIVAAPDKCFTVKDLSFFNEAEKQFIKPFYTSTARYTPSKINLYILYLCDKNFADKNIDDYPNIKNHFEQFKTILEESKMKYGTPNKPYFYLHREREEKFFKNGPKIIGQTRTEVPSFLYTEDSYYGSRAMNFIRTDRINLKYLIGLLNSNLVYFWLKNKGKQLGDLLQIDKGPLLNIPLLKPEDKIQEEIALQVDGIMELYKKYHDTPKNTEKWEYLDKEIKEAERNIDQVIYELYNLTPEEIKVIENS